MRMNRRKWLKKSAAIGFGSLGLGTVRGAPEGGEFTPADYRQSLNLRRQNDWSVTDWRNYLASQGADIRVADTRKSVSTWHQKESGQNDSISSQIDPGYVDLSMTYYIYDGGGSYIDFNWFMDPPGDTTTSINEATNQPDDKAAVGWSDNDYVKDGDTYFDNYGSHISGENSVTPQGVAINWADAPAGLDAAQQGKTTVEGWFGVPIEPRSGSDPDQRRLYVDFYHLWSGGTITGISFSPAPSIGFDWTTQYWVKEDDKYEKDIKKYIGGP